MADRKRIYKSVATFETALAFAPSCGACSSVHTKIGVHYLTGHGRFGSRRIPQDSVQEHKRGKTPYEFSDA